MGANAIAFIRALGLAKVDVLGILDRRHRRARDHLQAPELVRKLILGAPVHAAVRRDGVMTQAAGRIFGATYDPPEHVWLAVQFSPSEAGQAAGRDS